VRLYVHVLVLVCACACACACDSVCVRTSQFVVCVYVCVL